MLNDRDTRELRALIAKAYPKAQEMTRNTIHKPSTAIVKWLRDIVRQECSRLGDTDRRCVSYCHTIQLWDELGLLQALYAVAREVREYHGKFGPADDASALSPAEMRRRVTSFRTILTRNLGKAMYRIRYSCNGRPHLVTAKIERGEWQDQ